MYGLEQIGNIAAASMISMASYGGISCEVPKAPEIEVIPVTSEIRYDYSKNLVELNAMGSDTVSPYEQSVEQHMLGLHEGTINISYSVDLSAQVYEQQQAACVYFKKVSVKIKLNPVIYVVNELEPGSCPQQTVLGHEHKHVNVDRQIANEYAEKIGYLIQEIVNRTGSIGPYRSSDVHKIQQYMSGLIGDAIKSYQSDLEAEQARRQQNVDSLQEYERVAGVLKNECHFDVEQTVRASMRSAGRTR